MASTELKVLSSILHSRDMGPAMARNIDSMFVDYGDVWKFIKDYNAKYAALPTPTIVSDTFRDFELLDVDGATAHYIDTLTNEHVKGEIERVVNKAKTMVQVLSAQELLAGIQKDLGALNKFSTASRDVNIMDFDEAAADYAKIRAKVAANGGVPGIPTGIIAIDSNYTTGFAGGDLIVFLEWTGRGKSLLSELVCCRAWEMGHKPMIISLEMSPQKVRDRCYTILGSGLLANSSLAIGDINEDDFRTWSNTLDGPEFIVPEIDDGGFVTPNWVRSKIEQHRPGVVVLDYAQLAMDNAYSGDMTARMRNMSTEYKALAMAMDIPIILISSATPENGVASIKNPPIVEQVAWSRQLSYDSDLAIAVHRREESNIIELVGRKNRNGDLFAAYLDWDINNGIIKEIFEDLFDS